MTISFLGRKTETAERSSFESCRIKIEIPINLLLLSEVDSGRVQVRRESVEQGWSRLGQRRRAQ